MQEALTNALRHADASQIMVSAVRSAKFIDVAVADNGRGCDCVALANGFGVAGIRERASAFGGKALFERNKTGGLTVSVRFGYPLKEATP